MPKVRFFHGNGKYTKFAQVAYQKMMSGEWFTYGDIMSEYTGGQVGGGISYYDNYGELKKVVGDERVTVKEEQVVVAGILEEKVADAGATDVLGQTDVLGLVGQLAVELMEGFFGMVVDADNLNGLRERCGLKGEAADGVAKVAVVDRYADTEHVGAAGCFRWLS